MYGFINVRRTAIRLRARIGKRLIRLLSMSSAPVLLFVAKTPTGKNNRLPAAFPLTG